MYQAEAGARPAPASRADLAPLLALLSYALALVVELGVATALLLGYRTREAAAVMAVFSVMSALMFHHQFSDKGQLIQFLTNLAIAGGFVQLMLGPVGRWSLDARRQPR